MNYAIFYNYHLIGDVLMVLVSDDIPTQVETHDDVVGLFHHDTLVGYNILNISRIMKIKTHGLVVAPNNQMIDVINSQLKKAGFEHLPYKTESGFRIGEVISSEEHPDSDHLHVTKVNVGDQVLDIVCGANNCRAGLKTVVALPGTMMFDGMRIVPSSLRGIKSSGMLCSTKELHFPLEAQTKGIIELEPDAVVGADFFSAVGG